MADAQAEAKAEDPIDLPPGEQQKLAEAQEKAARELAEKDRSETLPDVPATDSDRRDPLQSSDEERRLRDGAERATRERDEAVREVEAQKSAVPASRCANRCCVPSVSGW